MSTEPVHGVVIAVVRADERQDGHSYIADLRTDTHHEVTTVTLVDDGGPRLGQLQTAVGGYIEAIPTSEDITIFVNEEGKFQHLPRNTLGELIWARGDPYGCLSAGDWIAGPVAIFGPAGPQGETTSCPLWVYELLEQEVPV